MWISSGKLTANLCLIHHSPANNLCINSPGYTQTIKAGLVAGG